MSLISWVLSARSTEQDQSGNGEPKLKLSKYDCNDSKDLNESLVSVEEWLLDSSDEIVNDVENDENVSALDFMPR